ncbi:hypothetical protein DL96DRAFT_1714748 [Flagelloscypha sp. PMI_526]|nr:hypothetical protein DL96DRAFT_1714748 [Flagelloscypha sp. PMI_526]
MDNQNDASTDVPAPPLVLSHHPIWYSESMAIFQVEDTLFRVCSCKLAESSSQFRDMVDRQDQGHSDDKPVVLDDSKADFCSLPTFLNPHKAGRLYTVEEWLGVLRLAQKYGFPKDVSNKAVERLTHHKKLSASELYELGRTFNVPKFTEMDIMRFCNAKSSLSPTDGQQIGLPLAFAIAAVREHLLASHTPFERHLSNMSSSDREDLVRMVRNAEAGRDILDGCSPSSKTISSGGINPGTSSGSIVTGISSGGINSGISDPGIASSSTNSTVPLHGSAPSSSSGVTNSVVPSTATNSGRPSRTKLAARRPGGGMTASRPPIGVDPVAGGKKRPRITTPSSTNNDADDVGAPNAPKRRKTAASSSMQDASLDESLEIMSS